MAVLNAKKSILFTFKEEILTFAAGISKFFAQKTVSRVKSRVRDFKSYTGNLGEKSQFLPPHGHFPFSIKSYSQFETFFIIIYYHEK
jgi:hypothetical protein